MACEAGSWLPKGLLILVQRSRQAANTAFLGREPCATVLLGHLRNQMVLHFLCHYETLWELKSATRNQMVFFTFENVFYLE